jgi:3-phenylpropionate/trans-cinnamate dioxygenase ferredoxin reductase subunit
MTDRDLNQGVPVEDLPPGAMVAGRLGEEEIVLVNDRGTVRAIGAHCTHYHGPLAEGLLVNGTIRCPWHHACFDLKTGAVLRAPALSNEPVWRVLRRSDRYYVGDKLEPPPPASVAKPDPVVIIGAGAAGVNVADTLRREGYAGRVVLISRDADLPFDKPNLSKDYLAGNAPIEWLPLHPQEHYDEYRIELRLAETVSAIDTTTRSITLSSGERIEYGALVIATGSVPNKLPNAPPNVQYLRTRRDAERIVEMASSAKRALVIGSSFIGLEVAASLRHRGLDVTVTSPDAVPLERVLGREVGQRIRAIHESHGVVFHLGSVVLPEADLIVAGIGVTPQIELAKIAGLATDKGIVVDEYLRTSSPDVYACGDVASWPGAYERMRVEHWVVAGRQGQTVARNILGQAQRFDAVPFFWSAHYDVVIAYAGHGSGRDDVEIRGSLSANDATIVYRRDGRVTAVATVGRDLTSLRAEAAMERGDLEALSAIL